MSLSRDGKALLVALLVALVAATLRFLDAFQKDESLVSTILHPLVLLVTVAPGVYSLRNVLPRRNAGRLLASDEYGWSFGRAVTLGVLGLVAALIVGTMFGVVTGLGALVMLEAMLPAAEISDETVDAIAMAVSIQGSGLFVVGAFYFVGRGIGRNCKKKGVYAVMLVPLVFLALNVAINTSSMGLREYLDLFSRTDMSVSDVSLALLGAIGVGLLGFWRGRSKRLSAYVHYLVAGLSPDGRSQLLESARAEASSAKEPRPETGSA